MNLSVFKGDPSALKSYLTTLAATKTILKLKKSKSAGTYIIVCLVGPPKPEPPPAG